ncbi:MAG: ArsR family transcriptional regulator [Planctomycetes bacterium]|nr:ArsR family transcriptional regulator [Planctomycetota bacterium]
MKPMSPALANLPSTLKLLSDPVRLRLCALLARAELAVQELVDVTGLQQSRVSNHLSRLKRAGLVRDRREGTWSFHSLVEPTPDGPLTPALFAATIEPSIASAEGASDVLALETVLDRRRSKSREMHDRLANRWPEVGQEFALGTLRSEILAQAFPCGPVVADLGCGAGFLALWLAERGAKVVAVDHSEGMLHAAQARPGAGRVSFRRGELDDLPLAADEVDAAFANLVWHHLPDHDQAAREVFRVVGPGGRVVVSDLLPHDAEWMREAMGDLRLGLKPETIMVALARAGFVDLVAETARDRYCVSAPGGERAEFPMFVVRGSKPARATS